jgi:hypothetical protein
MPTADLLQSERTIRALAMRGDEATIELTVLFEGASPPALRTRGRARFTRLGSSGIRRC